MKYELIVVERVCPHFVKRQLAVFKKAHEKWARDVPPFGGSNPSTPAIYRGGSRQ